MSFDNKGGFQSGITYIVRYDYLINLTGLKKKQQKWNRPIGYDTHQDT